MTYDKAAVQSILDQALAEGRTSLSAPEAKLVADAYGIPTPGEGLATTAEGAAGLAAEIGFPVVLKIVSPDILHKTEAGGVVVGVDSAEAAVTAYEQIVANAKAYQADAEIIGVQVQKMLVTGGDVQEVIVGAVTDQTFGKIVAFGLGGVLVEVLKDVTFRLAPTSPDEARSMVDGIEAHEMLNGVRGAKPVDKEAIATIITKLSDLVEDFPQFAEVDLNPVLAGPDGATAVDFRIIVDPEAGKPVDRYSQEEILTAMTRIMKPRAIAVIGASNEDGKIGNSVMKNLVNGGYQGDIYPINPKGGEVLGLKAFPSITDVPGDVDVAVFAVPAKFVGGALEQCGEKGVAGAILIPSGFAETGEQALQDEVVAIAKKHGVRILGPNIYGYYSTWQDLCATFCTPYDVKGGVALTSQSGGIGMAILGFARTTKTGVSAIV
ncbi:MAG TPA: acetate--CoA ligase family protein, partial [Kribbella sp.]|uniref:acetate--CoA ligase family protein n=1 Tax=Kribbella sp. TaxID=1871183 RepID=UPI002D778454